MSESGGAIYCEEAYAQGKMLDHSEWQGKLPRSITPSDIDQIFDNDGKLLACEWSRSNLRWNELTRGQRDTYMAVVKSGHMAALLKHSVPRSRKIKTRTDVESFQVIYLAANGKPAITDVIDGYLWPIFVDEWYRDPYLRLELHKPYYLKTL